MKLVKTHDAVGHVLCHDITQIIRGVKKGPVFKKGHVVREEDIPVLLSVGKENLYIYQMQEGIMHEDDAAAILYDITAGENIVGTPVSEGKIEAIAACDGMLRVNDAALLRVNSIGRMIIATRHGNTRVSKGDKLAGMRIIPFVIEEEAMRSARAAAGDEPLLSVLPFSIEQFGVVTTGSEVSKGLIEDTFTSVVEDKMAEFGAKMKEHVLAGDDAAVITDAVVRMVRNGCEMVLCTGGMSIDPDDRTPLAIKNTGANIVGYGAPTLPGAMFLLSYLNGVPVLGLPGCVMYERRTIFDLVLPRLMADVPVSAADFAALGHGGLCLMCQDCTFPNCGYGK